MLTRRTPLVLVALTAAVLEAGCAQSGTPVAQGHGPTPAHHRAPATTNSTTTTSTTQPPVAPITWSPCDGDLQCGALVVPLDYAHPAGPTISVAVARHPAEDPAARIGSLVIDPGGPGVSGINDIANELSVLTPQLLDDFDIVMFDPRGVERSDPVTCGTDTGSAPTDPAPVTASQQAATIAGLKQFAAACEKSSASVLPYVGTVDVARDMDRLRQALGDAGLTYMGQSYGTLLGLTYAALFPTHIRAMVLDSVIDPALSFNQITAGQADGFEGVLDAFFTWCSASEECAWHTGPDPTATLQSLLTTAATSPAPAGGGSVAGVGQLYDALLEDLYSQSDWPQLGQALADDAAGNGGPAAAASNSYNTGGSDNADDAATAIDCLDHPVSRDLATYGALGGLAGAVRSDLRPPARLGRGGLCRLARVADTDGRAGGRPGLATHSGGRDDERPGHAVRLGGERGQGARPWRAADPRRGRSRRLLLQRVRPRRRPDLPRERADASAGQRVHVVNSGPRLGAGEVVVAAAH